MYDIIASVWTQSAIAVMCCESKGRLLLQALVIWDRRVDELKESYVCSKYANVNFSTDG
jgi:hypothetical protein